MLILRQKVMIVSLIGEAHIPHMNIEAGGVTVIWNLGETSCFIVDTIFCDKGC